MEEFDHSFLECVTPGGVNYFRMPIFEHFNKLPYHRRTIDRKWDYRQLYADMASRVIRSDIEVKPERPENKRQFVLRLLFRLDGDVFCHLQGGRLIVYAPSAELADQTLKSLSEKYSKPATAVEDSAARFFLLTAGDGELRAEPVKITRQLVMTEAELALHYGPDAVEFDRKLVNVLRTENGGATILHGPAGTGKTSYIRSLMGKLCQTHRFYYLPMNAMRFLAEPDVVNFWLREDRRAGPDVKKVVVLEDAEDILMQRAVDNCKQASVLLNVADGLLGDFLQLHLLCTVNAPIEKLDPAVVRPGRLLAYREFRRLNVEQARRIATARGITLPPQPDYSLAEIYRQPAAGDMSAKPNRQCGFAV